MAKRRKRRRPSAGPPPHDRRAASGVEQTGAKPTPQRRRGEPVPPSLRGVAIRAVIVAVLFYPYLLYIAGESPETSLLVSAIAFVLMLPVGLALDRWRYRLQRRRWERDRAGR